MLSPMVAATAAIAIASGSDRWPSAGSGAAPIRGCCAGAGDTHDLRERLDVVGAVVAAAVDEEGGRAGDVAEVGAVNILGDPGGAGVLLEIVDEAIDVEPELARVAHQGSWRQVVLM